MTNEGNSELEGGKCTRLFWIANDAWECERDKGHGGSHSAHGHKNMDWRMRLRFTVSWNEEYVEQT